MHDGTGLSPAACASPCAIKLHNITYANAPEGEPEEAMPGEEDEEDERVAWAAAEAAEGAADADDAWEDEYQREMTMEAEMMMEADAFGDG